MLYLKKLSLLILGLFLVDSLYATEMPEKKGKIVILTGTSSCRKSTIKNELMKKLKSSSWIGVSMDELEEPTEFDDEDDPSMIFEPNEILIEKILKLTQAGFNVLVDTVLLDVDVQSMLKKLQGFDVHTVLVYCPLDEALNRVKSRNERAESPLATPEQRKEARSPFQPVHQFTQIYQKSQSDKPVVDRMSPLTLQAVKHKLSDPFPDYDEEQDRLTTKRLKKEEIERMVRGVELDFGLDKAEEVVISPKNSYSFIVNSKESGIVEKIKEYIDQKVIKK